MLTGLIRQDMAFTRTDASFQRRIHAAERLKAAGYATAAFVSAFVLAGRFGLARGFDVVRRRSRRRGVGTRRPGDDRSRAGASAEPPAQPLFLWVHYFDPHAPYDAARAVPRAASQASHTAARSRRWTRSWAGWWRVSKPPSARRRCERDRDCRRPRRRARRSRRGAARQSALPVDDAGAAGWSPVRACTVRRSMETPVSTRRVFHTLLDWAGLGAAAACAAITARWCSARR